MSVSQETQPCRLIIESEEHQGMIFPLNEQVVTIGRGPDNSIQIIDTRMSRNHVLLLLNGEAWFVRDLGSKNGSLVNDRPVEGDHELRHGDRIQVGDTIFVFEQEGSSDDLDRQDTSAIRVMDDDGLVSPSHTYKMPREAQKPAEISDLFALEVTNEHRLSILYQISSLIASTLDLDELLDKILDVIQEHLRPDRAGIMIYDERYDILVPKASRRQHGSTDAIVISNTIISQVINDHEAVLVSDAPRDVRFSASDSIVIQRIHSAICVPLLFKDSVLGVLYLDRRRPAENYTEADLKLVVGIANQSSPAITNSRLHNRLLERTAQERELEIARQIQQRLLPESMPQLPGYELGGFSMPARMVGGDYYDVMPLPDGRVVLAVADVSGKGVPAAILISAVRAAAQVEVRNLPSDGLTGVVARLNDMICRDTQSNMFVTMFMAVIDPDARELTYCNAGHNYPLLRHANGKIDQLETGGPLLGVMPGALYETGRVMAEPGATLLMYTDGVTDMVNGEEEMFGNDRLQAFIRDVASLSAAEVCERLRAQLDAFRQGAEPFDDCTALVLYAPEDGL